MKKKRHQGNDPFVMLHVTFPYVCPHLTKEHQQTESSTMLTYSKGLTERDPEGVSLYWGGSHCKLSESFVHRAF